jgi:hypothetical protein
MIHVQPLLTIEILPKKDEKPLKIKMLISMISLAVGAVLALLAAWRAMFVVVPISKVGCLWPFALKANPVWLHSHFGAKFPLEIVSQLTIFL